MVAQPTDNRKTQVRFLTGVPNKEHQQQIKFSLTIIPSGKRWCSVKQRVVSLSGISGGLLIQRQLVRIQHGPQHST